MLKLMRSERKVIASKETKLRKKIFRTDFEDRFSGSLVIFMFFHFPKEASTDAAHVDGGSCTE